MTETLDRRPLNCTCGWQTQYNNDGEWNGRVVVPDFMCPSWPHPKRFLTPKHQPDKVEPMATQTVYLANPDIYETDLRDIVGVMDDLRFLTDDEGSGDLFAIEAKIVLGNKNGYIVGTLTLEEDFWKFTPENESDVEANVDAT